MAEALPGFACGERDPKGVVQLRMNNVDRRGRIVLEAFLRVPADEEMVARYRLAPGDVMFNNTNSTELVGKTALFTGFSEPVVFSNHFTRLRAAKGLEPAFLAWWLLQQWQRKVFESVCNRWVGQSAVKNDKLLGLVLPLPPLPEQRRIAGILSEQMQEVEKARKATEAQLEAARALPAAYLRGVFDSKEAKKWPRKRLDEVCEIQLGKMLSPKSKTGLHPRPYLRNQNVQWDAFDLGDVSEMDFSEREAAKFALRTDDLLVCEGGEPGRAAVWQGEIEPCYYQKALHRLRPLNGGVDSHFLMYRLWYGAARREFAESQTGATIAHLPAVRLAALELGVPDIRVQLGIVARVKALMVDAVGIAQDVEDRLGEVDKLPAALLRTAFLGEV